jgi:FkbM family methyltransferase
MAMGTILVNKNGLSFRVIQSKHQSFWEDVINGKWETQTFKVFERFLSPDVTYLDIGAWIGPTLLYAAQLSKQSFAFEPDPLAYQEILANVNLNPSISHVKVYEKLIGITNGKTRLGSRDEGGDSMSSILFSDRETSWLVDSVTLPDFVKAENLRSPLFIKIDIEGGEFALIPTLTNFFKNYQPLVLYLSLHPQFLILDKSFVDSKPLSFSQKITLIKAYIKLAFSLNSFKFIYDIYGNRTSIMSLLFQALNSENMTSENAIIAINEVW